MILGHSFVQRLHKDLKDNFDDRTKQNSDLQQAYIQLFGVFFSVLHISMFLVSLLVIPSCSYAIVSRVLTVSLAKYPYTCLEGQAF